MNAPRMARLLAGIADYCCDVWYTFRPSLNEFWDTVAPKYRTLPPLDLPGQPTVSDREGANGVNALAGGLHFHLMRICPVCGSHIGAPCTTADGKVTGPHKRRRAA